MHHRAERIKRPILIITMNLDAIFPPEFFELTKTQQEKELVTRLQEVTGRANLYHRLLGQVRGAGKVEQIDIIQQQKIVQ